MVKHYVFYSVVLVMALVCSMAGATTLTVGDKVKLETGFGAPYTDDLASVTYSYSYDPAYLTLDPASLATAQDIYEVVDGGNIVGVFKGTAKDGVVSAPVFEAIAPTPSVDGAATPTNITVNSVTAVNSKGKAISVQIEQPEPLTIVPQPEQTPVVWRFRFVPVGSN